VTLVNKAKSDDFSENESTSMKCEIFGLSKSKIVEILWFKDDIEIDEKNSSNLMINSKEMSLNFINLSHLINNGNYHCAAKLKNKQYIYSNKLEVKVKCIIIFYILIMSKYF
jgi:hypothetical protein